MDKKNTYVAIMAGGIGSRFWPASRTEKPKQFLDIMGVGKSLIRLTFERFLKLCPAENIFIVTNKQYKDLVKEHLPELSNNQILTEPSRNNTAPCIAYTAFKLQSLNPDANMVVAPSDHIILNEAAFIDTLQAALSFTDQNNALLTLGIQPSRPDTGYGYIEVGSPKAEGGSGKGESGKREGGKQPLPVHSFREKPDRATAEQYLEAGNYFWNAGIFIWKVEHVLAAFKKHAAEIHNILAAGDSHYNTPGEQKFIDRAYPTTPSISVDYAIMENADNVYTIPSDFGWSDLGTWASLHAECPQDASANVLQGGEIHAIDVQNSLIRIPDGKRVVVGGLDDYIIVDEGDVLLIWPKSREQEIKGIVKNL
jgi:mannose-1-phosphate guanylyltransferase